MATNVAGAAYASVADLDGNGRLEIVVSAFGALTGTGTVAAYEPGATLASWSRTASIIAASDQVRFPNQAVISDIDGDGDLDVFVPGGFFVCLIFPGQPCGSLVWYEQTAPRTFAKRELVTRSRLWYHWVEFVDLDGDGVRDLVTVGEERPSPLPGSVGPTRAELQWLRGATSGPRFETTPRTLAEGGGSFPRVRDLDGDGDLDVATAEFFVQGSSFAWFENTGNLQFVKHALSDDVGPSIQLTLVENLLGDGVLRAVGANHTNTRKNPPDPWESAVFLFTPGTDLRQPWQRQQLSSGIVSRAGTAMAPQAAPGIFGVGDIDGDGDQDLLVSGDGDDRVFWIEQRGNNQWVTHVLDADLGQAGSMVVVDLNGDGKNELVVSSYEKNIVLVYERN